ncbi:MAG: polysaccharide pyruvyl transferase family protein, partial [Muribaculaceae bacterium]
PPNSTADRMSTLLRDVHLEQCITPIGKPIAEIAPDYDTSAASTRLQSLREQSLNWLRSTLK